MTTRYDRQTMRFRARVAETTPAEVLAQLDVEASRSTNPREFWRQAAVDLVPVRPVQLPSEGFVRLATVLAVFPVSRSTWWLGVREGRYPKPLKLSPGVTVWPVEEIRALLLRHRGDAREERTHA